MNEQLFSILYTDVMKMLREELPSNLFYHNPEHTADVVQASSRIAMAENCTPHEILLIKSAALFHDTGYVRDMREHEKHGCDIAKERLDLHKASAEDINTICGLIMVTKVPQLPGNKLEEIICDADLDYLGRDDYFPIADNLYREFVALEKIKSEKDWIQLQVNFLQAHKYFTASSIRLRQAKADSNLRKLMEAVVG